MNDDRMTPEALAEIANRAEMVTRNHADWSVAAAVTLAGRDVPALLAEVERLRTAEESLAVENARLRAELEAITKQINRVRSCKMCAHHKSDVFENPCAVCNMIVKQNFEWARPCPANTPAQGATDETRGGGEG